MRAERIVRPPVDTLTRRVAAARDAARAETYHRLGPQLQPPRPSQLDGLLDVDPELGITRLAWLRRGATAAMPEVLKAELDRLEFLRRHGAGQLDLSHRHCALVGQPVLAAGKRPIRVIAWLGSRKVSVAIRICPPAAIRKSSWLSPSVSACRSALLGSGCRIWRKPTTAGRRRAERYCARRDTLSANCRKRQIGGLKPGGCRGSEARPRPLILDTGRAGP